MSWSVSVIGKPANVSQELDRYGETLSGQCKLEFDEARPHIQGLLAQNFANAEGYVEPVIKLIASGSGCSRAVAAGPDQQLQRSCHVSIEPMWMKLV